MPINEANRNLVMGRASWSEEEYPSTLVDKERDLLRVETQQPEMFEQLWDPKPSGRVSLQPESVRNGLAQLVLTLIKLLHELLEKQAIRRMEADSLSEEQINAVGYTLMRQAQEIERLAQLFDLTQEDLNLDLGPLGQLL